MSKEHSGFSRRSFAKTAAGLGLGLAAAGGVSTAMSKEQDRQPLQSEEGGQAMQDKMATNVTPEGYEGNVAVCTMLVVKSEMEQETDAMWVKHKKWLKETHGPWGMVSYTIAKHGELKNPLDPSDSSTTDRIVYCAHEVYRHLDGLKKHYAEAENADYLQDFLKICTAPGNSFTVLQGTPVIYSLLPKDCVFPIDLSSSSQDSFKFKS